MSKLIYWDLPSPIRDRYDEVVYKPLFGGRSRSGNPSVSRMLKKLDTTAFLINYGLDPYCNDHLQAIYNLRSVIHEYIDRHNREVKERALKFKDLSTDLQGRVLSILGPFWPLVDPVTDIIDKLHDRRRGHRKRKESQDLMEVTELIRDLHDFQDPYFDEVQIMDKLIPRRIRPKLKNTVWKICRASLYIFVVFLFTYLLILWYYGGGS